MLSPFGREGCGKPSLAATLPQTGDHDVVDVFANFTGLFAALILLALLVTSNDASLRKLGLPGWKSLQRWNYACFALTVFHTFGYLIGIESLEAAAIITASLCVMITAWLQWEGWRSRA
jgi:sulfoxide reductase heme-binding subunit YedZ